MSFPTASLPHRVNVPSHRHPTPRRTALRSLTALLLLFAAVYAHAQQYTSIVVFGDSLSDTGNVADLFQATYGVRIPGSIADYTDGRFTDGTDTFPAAVKYTGVWVEQLAALLPSKPAIKPSLESGNDYAYGFAFTKGGTSPFSIASLGISVNVDNIALQITHYLATHPKIDNHTLFVVWGGANDVLNATTTRAVVDAAIYEAADVQRLVDAGATQFLIPNLPPLGATPRLNGSAATSVAGTKASILFNDTLAASLDVLNLVNFFRRLHIYRLDVFNLFRGIIASPSSFAFTNIVSGAQGKPVAADSYLFWDDLHPTTHGHNILASSALKLLTPSACAVPSGCPATP